MFRTIIPEKQGGIRAAHLCTYDIALARRRRSVMVVTTQERIPLFSKIRDRVDLDLEIINPKFLDRQKAVVFIVEMMEMYDAVVIWMPDCERMDLLKTVLDPVKDDMRIMSIGVDASVWSLTTVDRKTATECYKCLQEGGEQGCIDMLNTFGHCMGWDSEF